MVQSEENIIKLDERIKHRIKKYFKTLSFNLRKKDRTLSTLTALSRSMSYISFSKEDKGITLVGEETTEYWNILNYLIQLYPKSNKFGKGYWDNILKEAILCLAYSESNPSESWKDGMRVIDEKCVVNEKLWDVYFPVSGIAFNPRKQWSFGAVTFLSIDGRKFKNLIKSNISIKAIIPTINVNCVMHISVMAADHDSAINKAQSNADIHISVLNALANISGSTKHRDTLSSYMFIGEAVHSYVIAGTSKHLGWSRGISLNIAGFNPHLFIASQFIKQFPIRKIQKDLRLQNNDLFLKRILPTLKWMGKSLFQRTNEEIFLYYCLAFESLLFETSFTDNVIKTLQMRVKKFLFSSGRYLSSSINSYNNFSYIYALRSAIVHRGGVEVSDADIQLIRDLVVSCIYKFYTHDRFRRMTTSVEFEQWLSKHSRR